MVITTKTRNRNKEPKGFVIRIGDMIIISLPTFSEAVYRARRNYNHSPAVERNGDLTISINNKILYRYDRVSGKERFMSLSSHYAESFEGSTYNPDYPTMPDDIKESLDKFDIPLFIENMTRRESGQYGVYQDYHVRLDTNSVEYKQADRKKHFASSRYTCGLPEDKGRKAAYENEIKPNYEGRDIPVLLKGYPSKSHPGKTYYKFEDVPDEEELA